MRYQAQIIMLVMALAVTAGAYGFGYHRGSLAQVVKIAEETAKTQEELFDLSDTVMKQTAILRQLTLDKQELINALEQEATSATGSDSPGVSTTGGLQRLQRRWTTTPTTP